VRSEAVDFACVGEGAVGLDGVADGDEGDLEGVVSGLRACCGVSAWLLVRMDDA